MHEVLPAERKELVVTGRVSILLWGITPGSFLVCLHQRSCPGAVYEISGCFTFMPIFVNVNLLKIVAILAGV